MMTLRRKLTILVALAAIIPVVTMLGLTIMAQNSLSRQAKAELNQLVKTNVGQVARDIYAMCETVNKVVQSDLDMDLLAAREAMSKYGEPELGDESANWDSVHPATQQARKLSLPKFLLGKSWIGQNQDAVAPTPVVDNISRLMGCNCTIFQRMNKQGDMLSIATTLSDEKGLRAIGSFMPAFGEDGSTNPIIESILKGDTFRGIATALTNSMLTTYSPITNVNGQVIGMLFVGKRPETIAAIRQAIARIHIGKDGYLAVIGGKSSFRGHYLLAPDPKDDGKNIWDASTKMPDGSDHYFVRSMVSNSIANSANTIHFERYPWPRPGIASNEIPLKMAACLYFEPWDWVICATLYEEDYHSAVEKIQSTMRTLAIKLISTGIAILLLSGLIAFLVGTRMAQPLGLIASVSDAIARGEIDKARTDLAKFETESQKKGRIRRFLASAYEVTILMQSFREMIAGLETLIRQVQHSGILVTTSATEIAANARQMESAATEQAASVREVTETTREIAGTTEGLVDAMDGVAAAMAHTTTTAESGRTDLSHMEHAMRQLVGATSSISSKLAVINDKANKISNVVTAINKISDQTNLLSLNAAIEAESAGEYGRGFAVVARETSRLAEQTATATQDIERMVREMQSSVSSGVMEMDKFADEVRKSVDEVATISGQLASVIDQVKTLAPRFDQVKEGMNHQSQGAQQISEAMKQLSEVAVQTKESLHEFNKVAEHLNAAVQCLKGEVTRFRIG